MKNDKKSDRSLNYCKKYGENILFILIDIQS